MNDKATSGVGQGGTREKPLLQLIGNDPALRHFIRHELTDTYQIRDSPDGLTGYQQARVQLPDVIVSSVTMPGMDGLTMCRQLKNDPRTGHIPVVLLTDRSSDEQALAGLDSGADDFVQKPFNLLILKAKLRNLVNARDALRHYVAAGPAGAMAEEAFLGKARAIVEQNLSNPAFDARDFAKAVGMSRAQLYRKLHALSGQTVKEFVRVIRLKRAALMLIHAEHNISQAAFEVGFSSVAYFTRAFKNHYGLCPTQYIARKLAGK